MFTFVPLHAAVVGSSDLLIFEGFEACMYEEKIGGWRVLMLSCLQYESSPNSFTQNIKRDFIKWQSLSSFFNCLYDNVATSQCLLVSNASHVPTLLHMTLKEISAAVDDDGTGMAPSLCSIFSGSLTKVKRKCCHWQSFCYPTMWWCGLTSSIHHRKWFLHKTYLPMSYRVCSGKMDYATRIIGQG